MQLTIDFDKPELTQAEVFLKMLPCETKDFRNTNLYSEYRRAKCDAKQLLERFGAKIRLTCTRLTENNYRYDAEEVSQEGQVA